MPVGNFDLQVTGLSARGERFGVADQGRYHRAAPFAGPYHQPVLPYDRSGMLALDKIMHKTYEDHWLTREAPDPTCFYYRYPAKVMIAPRGQPRRRTPGFATILSLAAQHSMSQPTSSLRCPG